MAEEDPKEDSVYNVAFVYTEQAGGYEGVVTWGTWESKEAFDAWYTDEIRARERVVEEDITRERAIELVDRTPMACRVAAAIQEATLADGTVVPDVLEMQMLNVMFAEAHKRGAIR